MSHAAKQEMRIAERSIVTIRTFPYAIDRVWRMWTEPRLIEKWFGPDGFTTTTQQFRFEVGGRWTFVMHGPDGKDYPNDVKFEAIEPKKLIQYDHVSAPRFTTFVEFRSLSADSTEIVFTQVFESKEERDRVAVYAEPANQQFMSKLEHAIATTQRLVVRGFAVSVDGLSAGLHQSAEQPFGTGGLALMNWAFPTKYFVKYLQGRDDGEEGLDNDFATRADENIGATIMGRHMFGPDRGPWDLGWKGWWGDNPPYHHPVFVLCHQPRESFALEGGTSFTFVTDGIESALRQAFGAAQGKDVRLGGGAATVRQYLAAGLVDELHLVQSPLILGQGEPLFQGIPGFGDRYEVIEFRPSKAATHLRIVRKN